MLQIFRTVNGKTTETEDIKNGDWVALTNPTAAELLDISARFNIDIDDLKAPLDEEERARVEQTDT